MKINIINSLALGAVVAAGALQASAADDYVLSGYQIYNTQEKLGWYHMKSDGEATFAWTDVIAAEKNYPMVFGWMRQGRICGVSSLYSDRVLYNYDYLEINPENGEYYVQTPVSMRNEDGTTNYLNYFHVAAYNPDDDRVYGYGYNAKGTEFVFKSTSHDFTDTKVIRIVPDAEYCSSLTYNETEHRLVGFNRKNFVYIDTRTGEQTAAFNPGLATKYQYSYTGMVFDVAKRAYYWNYFTKDGISHMALVDLAGQKLTPVCDYNDKTQYSFMVYEGAKVSPEAPAFAEITAVNFVKDALSGEVVFTLPSLTEGGSEISGNIDWTLSIDGKSVAEGSGAAGESVTGSTGTLTAGEHIFDVSTKIGDYMSLPSIVTRYVGLDVPAAPADVVLNDKELSWSPVTTGEHGGYVNPEDVEYSVTFNGTSLGTTKECRIAVTYPSGKPYEAYSGAVTASNASGISASVKSNAFLTGEPLSIPRTFVPDEFTAHLFTMYDADSDGNGWTYVDGASGQELFVSGYSENSASDDWFFLPPMACNDPEKVYSFSINAALNEAGLNPAMLEVKVGTAASPEAMKSVVIPATEISGASLKEYSGLFTVRGELEGAKSVVIGVRAYSADGGTTVKARRFKVEATKLSVDAPADPADVKVVAAEKGELKSIVTLTFPTRLLGGAEIPASQDITVNIFDDVNETVTGKPGETKTVTVGAYQGINQVEITPALGSVKGNKKVYEVYCGIDVPKAVRNLEMDISEDNLYAEIYWDAPDAGLNGGYIDPTALTYWLCTTSNGGYKQYAELGKDPVYLMQVEKGSKLSTYQFAIQAVSSAGASSEYMPLRVQLGTPYELNIVETFLGPDGKNKINFAPLTAVSTGEYANTNWNIKDPSSVNSAYATPSGVAIVGTTELAGTKGMLMFPKFTTKGMTGLKFEADVYVSSSMADVTLFGRAFGMDEDVVIGKFEGTGTGYRKLSFDLPAEFEDCGWAGLHIVAEYPESYRSVVIAGYSVTSKDASGVDHVIADSSLSAFGGEGFIGIAGKPGASARVYTSEGVCVANVDLGDAPVRVGVAPGVYVVCAENRSVKVIVK